MAKTNIPADMEISIQLFRVPGNFTVQKDGKYKGKPRICYTVDPSTPKPFMDLFIEDNDLSGNPDAQGRIWYSMVPAARSKGEYKAWNPILKRTTTEKGVYWFEDTEAEDFLNHHKEIKEKVTLDTYQEMLAKKRAAMKLAEKAFITDEHEELIKPVAKKPAAKKKAAAKKSDIGEF